MITLENLHDDEDEANVVPTTDSAVDPAVDPAIEADPVLEGIKSPRGGGPAPDPEPEPADPAVDPEVDPEPEPEEVLEPELSTGVEQFLAQKGIVGGMITFEGENEGDEPVSKHFSELTSEEQFQILTDLTPDGSSNDLDEDEAGLIDWVRTKGTSVEEAIESLAQDRVDQIIALQDSNNTNYADMSNEGIVAKWLKINNPEATDEDLAEELSNQTGSKFFDKQANAVRSQFIADQKLDADNIAAQKVSDNNKLIESDRAVIADVADSINTVAGWDMNDDMKNEVLESLLEVNDNGDSLFMEKVFGDPKEMFKAAWLYKFGESHFDQLETYYKKEINNQYNEGKRVALDGLPPEPIPGGYVPGKSKGKKTPVRQEKIVSLSDLHSEDD